jgi:hypothetical protein
MQNKGIVVGGKVQCVQRIDPMFPIQPVFHDTKGAKSCGRALEIANCCLKLTFIWQ